MHAADGGHALAVAAGRAAGQAGGVHAVRVPDQFAGMGRAGGFVGGVVTMRRTGVAAVVVMRMVFVAVPVIMGRVIRRLVTTLRLGPVQRMPGVTILQARSRHQRRQAGNRQHQHPAQQSVDDPFHVGQDLMSRGVAPITGHQPTTTRTPCRSVLAHSCPAPGRRGGTPPADPGLPPVGARPLGPTGPSCTPSARGLASYASARSITSRRSRDSSSAARRSSSARICSPRALSTFCQRVSGWARRAAVCGFIASSFSMKAPMRR